MIKAIAISLVVGALVTSFVEYKLNYNLVDLLKDKILGLFAKLKGAL